MEIKGVLRRRLVTEILEGYSCIMSSIARPFGVEHSLSVLFAYFRSGTLANCFQFVLFCHRKDLTIIYAIRRTSNMKLFLPYFISSSTKCSVYNNLHRELNANSSMESALSAACYFEPESL